MLLPVSCRTVLLRLNSCLVLFLLSPLHAEDARFSVATQVDPLGVRHLFLSVNGESQMCMDRLVFKLPRAINSNSFTVGSLPPDWRLKVGRHKLQLTGPAQSLPFRCRLVMSGKHALQQVRSIGVHCKKKVIFKREHVFLKKLPPLVALNKLRGLLVLPPLLVPGDLVEMRILDPEKTPADGQWSIAGVVLKAQPEASSGKQKLILKLDVPNTLAAGQAVPVTYQNALGQRTVDVIAASNVRVVPAPTRVPQKPRLLECTVRGVLGGKLCVGGWFPDTLSRSGLLFDGKPAGLFLMASNQTLFLPLIGLSPGVHQLSGDPAVGYSPSEMLSFEVIDVQAEYDKSELVEGQVTNLTFYILGSVAQLKIRVINSSPEVISIIGGNDQVIQTFGGGGNIATRSIETLSLGNFQIEYELDDPHCPCTKILGPNGLLNGL